MPVTLRTWEPGDEPFLWEMLYQSIHVAEGQEPPPRSALDDPPIHHYLAGFGSRRGDDAVIACSDGVPIGAAFCRLFGADDTASSRTTCPRSAWQWLAHSGGAGSAERCWPTSSLAIRS